MKPGKAITRNLLVLDVDETLIHGRETPLGRAADFRVGQFHIYKRPFLDQFLVACSEWFELGVWSSGSDAYVAQIVNTVFPYPEKLHFDWGSSRTKTRRTLPDDYERFGSLADYHDRKPLSKLKRFGWPLDRMLIVDDSPEKSAENYGNAIHPRPFEGECDDDELKYLARYLDSLKDHQSYMTLEKRSWRDAVEPMDW